MPPIIMMSFAGDPKCVLYEIGDSIIGHLDLSPYGIMLGETMMKASIDHMRMRIFGATGQLAGGVSNAISSPSDFCN